MDEQEILEREACYDIQDERDYQYSDVFPLLGWVRPEKVLLDNVEYENQWLEKVTKMMCVYYSTAHWSNEENFQEWSDVRIAWKSLWLIAFDLGRLDLEKGALVSNGPRTARDEWLISGWVKVKTVDEIKDSLINKRPIVVWSNKINWSTWYNSPYVLWWNKWSGHAVLIIWYDDNYEWGCFVIKNSYGDERFDSGKMYLKYENLWLLFNSKYSLIDEEDPILAYKKKVMENIDLEKAKEGFELGIWNWERPREPISRQETVTVILRALEKAGITIEK